MPDFDYSFSAPDLSVDSLGENISANPIQTQETVDRALGNGGSFGGAIAATAGFLIPDLIDTASASVGLTERGQVNESIFANSPIGAGTLRQWYNDNKGAVEIGSGIAAIVASSYAAGKILKPTGMAMRFVAGRKYIGTLATLDKKYMSAMQVAQKVRQTSAASGATAMESYTGNVVLARLGRPGLVTTPNKARSVFLGAAAKRGLAENVLTEGLLGIFANESFLYEGDFSSDIAWGALGLGIGAGVDILQAGHIAKKMANADTTKRLFSKAYDPAGTEAARIESSLADFNALTGSKSHMADMSGAYFDTSTSLALSAAEGRNASALAGGKRNLLFGRRERLSTQVDQEVQNTMNKGTVKGVAQIPGTGFAMSDPVAGETIAHMVYLDPTAMHGVEEIGRGNKFISIGSIGPERAAKLEARMGLLSQVMRDGGFQVTRKIKDPKTGKLADQIRIQKLKPEEAIALKDEYRSLVHQNSMVEVRALNGEWVSKQTGDLFDGFEMPKMHREGQGEDLIFGTKNEPGLNVGVTTKLEVFLPTGRDLNTMTLPDSVALHAAGKQVIDWHVASEKPMILPDKPTWFQLDMAETLIRKTGNESAVVYPAGLTRETALVEGFKQRAAALAGTLAKNASDSVAVDSARFIFNLPRLDAHTAGLLDQAEHPIETILRGFNDVSKEAQSKLTYQDIVKGFEDARKINQLGADAVTRADEFIGNMFDFGITNTGKQMEQLVAFKRPMVPFEWTKDNLAERLAFRKAMTAIVLTGETAGDLNRVLAQSLYNDPDFAIASKVAGLNDSQLQSSIPGLSKATPQSVVGGLLNDNVYREIRDRDTIELLAASRLNAKVDRIARANMKNKIDSAMGDILGRINGPANGPSRVLLNQFLTYRAGWELKLANGVPVTKSVKSANGRTLVEFVLDESSEHNAKRWREQFGVDLPAGAVMKSARGVNLALDELGLEFMARFNEGVTDDLSKEKNGLNKAQGLGGTNHLPLFAPPPLTKGKHIGFTLDMNGNPIRGGTIVADNPEQFARELARLEDPKNLDSPLNRHPDAVFRRSQDVEDFNSVWDKSQMDWQDAGLTAIQPGKRAQGALSGQDVNPFAIEDALTWARDSYLRHSGDVMRTIFKDQIVAAQIRSGIAIESLSKATSGRAATKTNSIYDHWMDNLLGRASGDSEASMTGRAWRGAEDNINRFLAEKLPTLSKTIRAATDFGRTHKPGDANPKAVEQFNALTKALGPHMPYKSTQDFMDKNYGIKRPPELAEITGAMSQFEAANRLRMFEVIHGVMNLGGIVNSIPSVVLHAQPLRGESAIEYATRNGMSTAIDLGEGNRIGVLSMPKLLYKTFKNTWNRKHDANWDYRVSQGFMTQEVAEYQRQMNSINDRGTMMKALLGDPKANTLVKSKGVVGMASVLSDMSEDFSRSWGHLVGVELAESMGIEGRESIESFAHEIANKMIANYDPKNRPAIFQGALGAPIGLFQSYIANYYGRMFRYIETGDKRAFAAQMASQAAFFGVTTVPGFSAVSAFMESESVGNDDALTSIYRKYGDETGDALLNGVVGNLPKLVNLLPGEQGVDGVALYSRGDTSVRLPGANVPPIIDSMIRVGKAVSQGIAAFKTETGLGNVEVAEIASNMLTNRPMAGFIEQAFGADPGIGAADTDNMGNVISESKSAMEVTARIMGTRSLRQQKELEAFYQNKNGMTTQNALKQDLNAAAKRAIREGNTDALPGLFQQYVERGGDARRYTTWVKRQTEAALETRGERMLDDMKTSPAKEKMLQRLLELGVSASELESGIDSPEPTAEVDPADALGGVPVGEMDLDRVIANPDELPVE